MTRRRQQGSFMIEALIGIVIFLMGVLAMIALQASSIAIQTDAQYRNEASNLADQILGQINLGARDPNGAVVAGTLAGFAHNPTGGTTTCRLLATDASANTDCCNFGGGVVSLNPLVTNWVAARVITQRTLSPRSRRRRMRSSTL
mgnify:CR=1 FL=1